MYDLIVIGAGPAGYEAVLEAATFNKKVLLVEKDKIGGTCLNYGCIPTKSLLSQTHLFKDVNSHSDILNYDDLRFDYLKILQNKDKTVDRLRKGVEFLLKKSNVDVIIGNAILESPNTILIEDKRFEAKKILLALGSKPASLNIDGFDNCIDSKALLDTDLSTVKQVVIIGGGVIGVEIATILSNLGINVIIVEAKDQLIFNSDIDCAKRLEKLFKREKVKIYLSTFINKIEKNKVYTEDKSFEGDLIISCVGRVANIADFDPKHLLQIDNNCIKVDDNFNTNLENVYAVGDCVKGLQLAHWAKACALNVVNSLYSGKSIYNLRNVPRCIYTWEEIASVGENEGDGDIVVKRDFVANARALIENQNRGFVKLIFTKEGLFKGASLMCSRASDMINTFVIALNNKLTINMMVEDIYPHPSFSEEIGEVLKDAYSIIVNK